LNDANIKAYTYHAGMKQNERKYVQNEWMKENIKVIVATIAFGIGINKRNVKFIIQNSMPKTLDEYIQKVGRAGRN